MNISTMSKKNYICLLAAIILAVLIKLLIPVSHGLTEKGLTFLAIFVATVFLWISCDTSWPSLLAMIALGMFNVIDATDIFTTTYGNYVSALVIAAMILSNQLEETGAAQYIAKWFLSRKAIKGRPFVFLLCIALATYVISVLVSAMLAVLVLIPIINASMESLGVQKNEKLYKASMLILFWLSTCAEFMLPFGKVIAIMMMNFVETYGFTIDVARYISVTIPLNIGYIAAAMIALYLLANPKTEKFSNYDVDLIRADLEENPLGRRAKFTIMMTVLCFILLLMPSMTFIGRIAAYLGSYETVLAYYVPIILMCLIPIDGAPVVDLRKDAAKVPWTLVLFLGVVMLFTSYTGSQDFGITAWIIGIMEPITTAFSPVTLLIFAVVITGIITNFISNMVTMTVSVTVFAPIFVSMYASGQSQINPAAAIIMLGFAASISCLTPASTPTAPVVYGSNLKVNEVVLPNLLFIAFSIIIVLTIGFLFGNLSLA